MQQWLAAADPVWLGPSVTREEGVTKELIMACFAFNFGLLPHMAPIESLAYMNLFYRKDSHIVSRVLNSEWQINKRPIIRNIALILHCHQLIKQFNNKNLRTDLEKGKEACAGEYKRRGCPTAHTQWGLKEQHKYMAYQNAHSKKGDEIGGRARKLPKHLADDEPAPLPEEIETWYEETHARQLKKNRSKSKERRRKTSRSQRSRSRHRRRKDSSSSNPKKPKSEPDYPTDGYELDCQTREGKEYATLIHDDIKEPGIELDPKGSWRITCKRDISFIYDSSQTDVELLECIDLYRQRAVESRSKTNVGNTTLPGGG